ncbi:MAG TPA: glycosyltransferase, partial [Burkholderiaceae bacterium]|nr:glycosyltransferase [Burkholderiaceae bacterium]
EGALQATWALPYLGPMPEATEAAFARALRLIEDEGVDTLWLQCYHGPLPDPRPFLQAARRLQPDLLVLVSSGDAFGRWLHRTPASLRQACAAADLSFLSVLGPVADAVAAAGARNLVLMPHGACQERFAAPTPRPEAPPFDVVFVGSHHAGRNPFNPINRAARQRRAMVQALARRHGPRFGLFGRGWEGQPGWQGPVPFADQHRAMALGRLQLGGFPGGRAPFYLSDRPYIAMASGTPLLDCRLEGVDRLAREGVHWALYEDLPGLLRLCDRSLEDEAGLRTMGRTARDYVLAGHTQYHRVREMLRIAAELREARRQGCRMPAPAPRIFHEGVRPEDEIPRVIRAWAG